MYCMIFQVNTGQNPFTKPYQASVIERVDLGGADTHPTSVTRGEPRITLFPRVRSTLKKWWPFSKLSFLSFRRVGYPWRFSPQWAEGGPGPLVSGRRCAASPGCTVSSIQEVCLVVLKGSWVGFGYCTIHSRSCVPSNKWLDGFESPQPALVL